MLKNIDREGKIRLDTIEKGIHNAHTVLQSASSRQEYRRQIFHLDEIQKAANELSKQGRKLVAKGEKISAMAAFMP